MNYSKVKVFTFSSESEEAEVVSTLKVIPGIEFLDSYQSQLIEYQQITNSPEKADLDHWSGSWVYYPWRNVAVKTLDEDRYARVRTDRNRNKITSEEQKSLSTKIVGVVGLSVGNCVATTLAMEGGFGELRIADFDTLDLSNLNRIRGSVIDLGKSKVDVTSQQILELNPYAKVSAYDTGITVTNIDQFFDSGPRLDLLIDECDSIDIKIKLRQKARELRVPVLMDTSDRGLLDIERFDVDPSRGIFHGLLDEQNLDSFLDMSPIQKVEILLGKEQISSRLRESMKLIGKELHTWPQLAGDVVMGGGVCADACRRILLGENIPSGRYNVEPTYLQSVAAL